MILIDSKPTKYHVPALARADAVLYALAGEPRKLKLMDLSRRFGINKSSMFCLLYTMETLGWVQREPDDTYSPGSRLGLFGGAFFRHNELGDRFRREAALVRDIVGETLQLARLEGGTVFYLAKMEAPGPVRIASDPGLSLPCHATALGKAMLAFAGEAALAEALRAPLVKLTPHTVDTAEGLQDQLADIRRIGLAYDIEEAVVGFCCCAAPVLAADGLPVAAVSASMPLHHWQTKRELAEAEIRKLAARLSADA